MVDCGHLLMHLINCALAAFRSFRSQYWILLHQQIKIFKKIKIIGRHLRRFVSLGFWHMEDVVLLLPETEQNSFPYTSIGIPLRSVPDGDLIS